MKKPPQVVIITTKLPEDIWMINRIADICDIEGIVLPSGTRYREYGLAHVLKKRIRRPGFFRIVDQGLLILYRLIFKGRENKRSEKKLFTGKPNNYIEKKDIEILEVENVNSDEVVNFIVSKAPQLVVVSAAPLLKKKIIDSVEGRIINLHPGLAPEYRGRYGSFWPVYYEEPTMVGVTIHFIDEGIDTGAILLQARVDFEPDDTLKTVTYRQHKLGVELLLEVLSNFDDYAVKAYHKTDSPSRNFIAPGLTHYLKARMWLKRRNKMDTLIHASGKKETEVVSEIGE